MAIFRQVHLSFWQDAFVIGLTPEEKYFYLYLMTNSKTRQCGIYELPKKVIELETGYNRETIDKLLKRFSDYEKIKYDPETSEIILVNWVKYNWINSKKVIALINKELKLVKNREFISLFVEAVKKSGHNEELLEIPYFQSGDTVSIPYIHSKNMKNTLPIQQEEEREEEREEEQEQEGKHLIENPFHFYTNNFGVISPFVSENIQDWINTLNDSMVIEAMKIALLKNKPFSYAEAIMKNWYKNNIRTLEDVEADRQAFERKNDSKGRSVKHEIGESSYE